MQQPRNRAHPNRGVGRGSVADEGYYELRTTALRLYSHHKKNSDSDAPRSPIAIAKGGTLVSLQSPIIAIS